MPQVCHYVSTVQKECCLQSWVHLLTFPKAFMDEQPRTNLAGESLFDSVGQPSNFVKYKELRYKTIFSQGKSSFPDFPNEKRRRWTSFPIASYKGLQQKQLHTSALAASQLFQLFNMYTDQNFLYS